MSWDHLRAARRPRYCSTSKLLVEVEQPADDRARPIQAELKNLSRNGYQVKVPVPLAIQTPLTLRLRIEGSPIDLKLPGLVRWQRPAPDGTWVAGCQADRSIDWETLGELFLSGALSTEGP